MAKYISKNISGYCPKQNIDYTISVSYANIPNIYNSNDFKLITIQCNHCIEHNQNYCSDCPLVNQTSKTL